jgi:predicted glycogen debranching enzyme
MDVQRIESPPERQKAPAAAADRVDTGRREYLAIGPHGSFALGCWDRVPRRKYHGLWISRALGGASPEHFLLDVLERARIGHDSAAPFAPLVNYDFGQGPGAEGRSLIISFRDTPTPCWTYDLSRLEASAPLPSSAPLKASARSGPQRAAAGPGHASLTRSFRFLAEGEVPQALEGIEVRYAWQGSRQPLELSLEPLFSIRDVHALTQENLALDGTIAAVKGQAAANAAPRVFSFQPYADMPSLQIVAEGEMREEIEGAWYRNFFYEEEERRGYPATEDCFCPIQFFATIPPESEIALRFFLPREEKKAKAPAAKAKALASPPRAKATAAKGKKARSGNAAPDPFFQDLARALGAFVYADVRNPNFESVIAGFPWFSSWARDTFISLPGLSLAWGETDRALRVLKSWAEPIEEQIFRGRSPDGLNATGLDSPLLWAAALQFLVERHPDAAAPDEALPRELMETLERWIVRLFQGEGRLLSVTDFGLFCAPGNYATSWMDAIVDGAPVTPRHGYPIEINSLFLDALDFLLRRRARLKAGTIRLFRDYLEMARPRFAESFWVQERKFIGDRHDGRELDAALRPNQLWAIAANFEIFSRAQCEASLQRATEELLTPFGLRTLSPLDSRYAGTYTGTQAQRDRAYHQGTVWPWLIGKYADAALKTWGPKRAKEALGPTLDALKTHFYEGPCPGQVSEIFDGDFPHAARGAPAQAWSAAEILRTIWLLESSKS